MTDLRCRNALQSVELAANIALCVLVMITLRASTGNFDACLKSGAESKIEHDQLFTLVKEIIADAAIFAADTFLPITRPYDKAAIIEEVTAFCNMSYARERITWAPVDAVIGMHNAAGMP